MKQSNKQMTKFSLTASVTISISTTVEAETLEEAIEKSKDREIESYNHNYLQHEDVWVSDVYDGEPMEIVENK